MTSSMHGSFDRDALIGLFSELADHLREDFPGTPISKEAKAT